DSPHHHPPTTTRSYFSSRSAKIQSLRTTRSGRVGLRVGFAATRRTPRGQIRPGFASQLAGRAHDHHDGAQHHEARDDRNRPCSTGDARKHAQGTPAIPNTPAHWPPPEQTPPAAVWAHP